MASIFISYSRENLEKAKTLVHDLSNLGHDAWYDQNLSGGQAWWNHIISKIQECELFIFVISTESLNSDACKAEHAYALQLVKNILPVLVDDDVDITLLSPSLVKIQHVDYRLEDKTALGSIAKAIASMTASPALPDPLPEPPPIPVSYLSSVAEQINSDGLLSFQDQTGILFRLKHGLSDSKNTERIISLLRKLRSRPDLFVKVAEEIDELLKKMPRTNNTIRSDINPSLKNFSNFMNHVSKEPKEKVKTRNKSLAFKMLSIVANLLNKVGNELLSKQILELQQIEREITAIQITFWILFIVSLIPFFGFNNINEISGGLFFLAIFFGTGTSIDLFDSSRSEFFFEGIILSSISIILFGIISAAFIFEENVGTTTSILFVLLFVFGLSSHWVLKKYHTRSLF